MTPIVITAVVIVAAVAVGRLLRSRRRSRVPFEQMTREEQVAHLEGLRGSAARRGADQATRAQGSTSMRDNWGGSA